MVKKRHEQIQGLSEREATKQYMQTLGEVYRSEGFLAAAGYEIKSTLFSLGRRIENLFERQSPSERFRDKDTYLSYSDARKEAAYTESVIQGRKAERHGYILRKKKQNGLENATAIASIVILLGSIFFISPSFTGNVVASLPNRTTNMIGAILFIIGIIGAFFCFRKR